MKCKHRKICNMCSASFKMTRGCELEKRCPACRIFRVSHKVYPLITFKRHIVHIGENSTLLKYCYYPQDDVIKEIASWMPAEMDIQEYTESAEDIVLREERDEAILSTITDMLNPRELIALKQILMEEYSTREVAKQLGISSARVGQIYSSAIKKIKHPLFRNRMRNYIE